MSNITVNPSGCNGSNTDAHVEQDLYHSYIAGRDGVFPKDKVIPVGFGDDDVESVRYLVLKPDGEQFSEKTPVITSGTKKGDYQPRRGAFLRYLVEIFSRALIVASGGSDASFHVALELSETVRRTDASRWNRLLRVLELLRVICFCDMVGKETLLPALTCRQVGSIHSKTNAVVSEVKPATGSYSLEELEEICRNWFSTPDVAVLDAWFGVHVGEKARCPIHDSADADMAIKDGEKGPVGFCFGANNCARDAKAARIQLVSRSENKPSLAKVLLADDVYRKRWEMAYWRVIQKFAEEKSDAEATAEALQVGKHLISITDETTDDTILHEVQEAFHPLVSAYCDPAGTLLTLETDLATGALSIRQHGSVEKFVSLVDRVAIVRVKSGYKWRFGPLPHNRASAILHRPELRAGLRVLTRVSKNPVLDLKNLRVQPPGYDPTTKVFYDGPAVSVREDGQTPHLDRALAGWTGQCGSPHRSCKTDSDVSHMYAAVATEILADSGLFKLHRHPILRGNQKGVGKDKFCDVLGILRDGETPVDLNHSDENRINQGFGNGIYACRRIFQVTNITASPYSNPMLARWLTSESLTGPKHGGGTWTVNPNTVTVTFTLNQGSIDHDLLDRLLPINLVVVGNARKRKFDFSPSDYVREHRLEIIGEVMGLALLCVKENREWVIPSGMDRRFERWMKIIGTVLEKRGLSGFMENLDAVDEEVDEDREDFIELMRRVYLAKGDAWLRLKEILPFCRSAGGGNESKSLFADTLRGGSPERSLSTYVLLRHVNEIIRLPAPDAQPGVAVALRRDEDAKNKSVVYRIEVLSKRSGDGGGDVPENGGDQCASPVAVAHGTTEIEVPTHPGGGNGGDSGDERGSTNEASPPNKSLVLQVVTRAGGDGGDKPLEGSSEGQEGQENHQIAGQNASTGGGLGSIPAIPAIPAKSPTDPQDDPWKGSSL